MEYSNAIKAMFYAHNPAGCKIDICGRSSGLSAAATPSRPYGQWHIYCGR